MELMNLIASLTLDTTQFDKDVAVVVDTPLQPLPDVKVGLDTTEYKKELDETEHETSVFGQIVSNVWGEISGVAVAAGVSWAVTKVVDTLTEGVNLARQLGDNIDKSSKAMGISATAYQEWDHVLQINGASITNLNQGLLNMKKFAQGGKLSDDVGGAFEKLHISAENANGSIKSTEQILSETIRALADYNGNDRDLLTNAIFGRNGDRLNAMLDGTSSDIDALIDQAHELGLVMTDDEIANAAAYNDAVSNMQASIDAFKTSLVVEILPLLTSVTNEVAKVFAFFNWRSSSTDGLTDLFAKIDKDGTSALVTLKENQGEALALIDKIASMGDYWTLDTEGKKTFDKLAAELIELYPQLDSVINENKNAITDNTDAIKANIDEWTKLEQQRILSNNVAEKREAIAKQYAQALDKEIEAELKDAEAVGKRETALAKLFDYFKTGKGKDYGAKIFWGTDGTEFTEDMYHTYASLINTLLEETRTKDPGTKKALEAWQNTTNEAETLRNEAAELNKKADEATESYTQYAEKLAEKLGITLESTGAATEGVEGLNAAIGETPTDVYTTFHITTDGEMPDGFAKGNINVPYDMPAYLHRGEMVLTKSQARKYREGGGDGSGAIVSAIQSMRSDLQNMKLVVGQRIFGKTVVDYGGNRVNNYIGEAENRAAAGYGA